MLRIPTGPGLVHWSTGNYPAGGVPCSQAGHLSADEMGAHRRSLIRDWFSILTEGQRARTGKLTASQTRVRSSFTS